MESSCFNTKLLPKSAPTCGHSSSSPVINSTGSLSFLLELAGRSAVSGAAGSIFLAALGIVLRPIVACTFIRQLRMRVFGLRNQGRANAGFSGCPMSHLRVTKRGLELKVLVYMRKMRTASQEADAALQKETDLGRPIAAFRPRVKPQDGRHFPATLPSMLLK
jgi:hypothetical protein